MKCTVCQFEYRIDYLNYFLVFKIFLFATRNILLFTSSIQGARIASIRERPYYVINVFLSIMDIVTTYSIIDPGINKFDGFVLNYCIFIRFYGFLCWILIWFVLIETLQLYYQ